MSAFAVRIVRFWERRVSEATGANIENLGVERGHRTLVITRKGGKVVTIPLAPRTARAIDLAVGERVEGPIFFGPDGQRLDRHGAARVVRRVASRAAITKPVGPLSRSGARFRCCHRPVSPDRSPNPPCELSPQRALPGFCRQAGFAGGHGAGILLPR